MTIDGGTGEVMLGAVPTVRPELGEDFDRLMGWADEARVLRVRTNAETPARGPARRAPSAPRASDCAAPSTCSSTTTASRRSAA